MPRFFVELSDEEWDALTALAVRERRGAREQAAHLIAEALKVRMGPPITAFTHRTPYTGIEHVEETG